MRDRIETLFLALLLLPAACAGDDTSSDSETATAPTSTGESASTNTSTTTESSTSGPTSSGGTDASGTDESATGSETEATGATESTGETTGGELGELCTAYCEHEGRCDPESVPFDDCLMLCDAVFGMPGEAACDAAAIELLECAVATSCDELLSMSGYCLDEEDAWAEACELVFCSGSFDKGAVECGFVQTCDDGTIKELVCDAEGCTCLDDGVEVGACVNDVCAEDMDGVDLVDKAEECCDF